MKKFIKNNWFKIILATASLIASSTYAFKEYLDYKEQLEIKKAAELPNCNFTVFDTKEYKGRYHNSWNNNNDESTENAYIVYEGLIKNNSNRTESLKAMIAKVYNEKDIFISEGYEPQDIQLESEKSVPFKVHTFVNASFDTHVRKYFNESQYFKPDIYPWFTTCK